jgi:predicted RND superfamily exporter protein
MGRGKKMYGGSIGGYMKRALMKIVNLSIDHPKKVIGVFFVVTALFVTQIPKISVDTDPENMLSTDEPVRVVHSEVKGDFNLNDTLVLGVVDDEGGGVFRPEVLERVARITDEILKIDGVIARDVISPTTTDDIQATGGILRIEPLMKRAVGDEEAAKKVRDAALRNPVLKNLLISEDGTSLSLFIPIKEKRLSYRISKEIEGIIESEKGSEQYHLTGLPVAEDTFGVEMFKQMAVAAPLSGLLIFLLMLFFFRRPLMVISSMVTAVMTVVWAMGLLIGAGFTVHIMSSMIPIFLMPIAVVDSVHLLSEFHDRFPAVRDRRRALLEVMDDLFVPMLFTSITSAVGFSSLMLTPIPPVKVFGAFVAFGIVCAWFLTITFIPAFIMVLPERTFLAFGRRKTEGRERPIVHRIQKTLGRTAANHPRTVLSAAAVILAVSVYGITLTVVNDNPVRWFHKGHPIRVADRILNERFGGTYMAYLVLEGKEADVMKDPGHAGYIEGLQRGLDKMDVVGKTTSITDVVKKVSFELHDEDPAYDAIPDTRNKIAQYLFLYEMSGDPDDLYHLVDPEYRKANIWVQLKSGDNRDMRSVENFVRDYMEKDPPPEGIGVKWAGLTYLNVVWQERMVWGMLKALAGSALAVFVIMTVLFRSPLWGLVSMIPLTLTITFIYGLVGILGKDYDMPIAVLSARTLGVSIDFAIHFCQRTRQISEDTPGWPMTVERVFDEPVRAILRNMVVIAVGFLPLLLSPLVPYRTVGFFFAAIMAASGLTTIMVLPSIMSAARGRLKL